MWPVVIRELRVGARDRWNNWYRVLAAGAVLLIGWFARLFDCGPNRRCTALGSRGVLYGQYGNDGYTIKYYADRKPDGTVEHQLSLHRLDGRASNGYRLHFPSSVMWKYRHLIGDQPLLAIPDAESN